jgi:hypothetical protein
MKIRSVAAELFHADRRTDRLTHTKLIFAFRNFASASKTERFINGAGKCLESRLKNRSN